MAKSKGSIYEFDGFRLEVDERLLTRDGEPVAIPAKAFDLLVALVENNGHLVEKETLYNRIWADAIVEDANLTVQMSAIRKALGNGYIQTVKGHGYRFAADVNELNGRREEYVVEQQTFARVTVEHEIAANNSDRVEKSLTSSSNASMLRVATAAFVCVALLAAGVWYLNATKREPQIRQPKLTRLTSSGNVHAVTSSPDGKYAILVLREKEGESLWLRHIETGSQKRITQAENIEYLGLTVSPDGNFVYAPVLSENSADPPLRKIPILGGPAHDISNIVISSSLAFSPDGSRVAFIESHQPETHLVVAQSDGSNAKDLIRAHNSIREFPIWKYNPVAWSSDGLTIAAGFSEKGENGSLSGVMLVDPNTGKEQIVIEPRWANVYEVAWLDADNLMFVANKEDWTNQIWKFNRKTGDVSRVTNDLNVYRWLSTTDGRLLAAQVNAVSSLHVAEVGESANDVVASELIRESGYFSNVAWGQDDYVLYSSVSTGKPEIWRIKQGESDPRQITADSNIYFGMTISKTDGTIIFSAKQDRKFAIWKADANGRNIQRVTDGADDFAPDVSADGHIVYQTSSQQVMRLLTTDNAPVELHRGLKPVISPDSSLTAFFMMEKGEWVIGLVATHTGGLIRKIELPTSVRQRRMKWHPSGKFLSLFFEEGNTLKLLQLPIDGSSPRIIGGFGTGDVNSFDWSTDGKRVVYSVTTETQDAVLLSDF